MANEKPFAGSVIKIDGTVVARVSSVRRAGTANVADVTGAENVSGDLAVIQRKTTSREYQLEIAGVTISAAGPVELEAGQSALKTAFEAGTTVVLQTLDANGKGHDDTSLITAYNQEASVGEVYKFSATLVVNSTATV